MDELPKLKIGETIELNPAEAQNLCGKGYVLKIKGNFRNKEEKSAYKAENKEVRAYELIGKW